jgi:hypothetical protein
MYKEWLSDYSDKEKDEYSKFLKNYNQESIEYPPRYRFKKLNNPISDTTTNIWTQIPLYGSSLIHLHPCTQESCIEMFGWGSDSDITQLISLAKDTGRVQFILDKDPKDYEPYDYLEPILKELRPPAMKLIPELIFDKGNYKISKIEYDTICGYKFIPHLQNLLSKIKDTNYQSFNDFSFKFRLDYATLKSIGYHKIADKILDSMIDNPELALHYFFFFGVIITPAHHDSFHVSYNPVLSVDGDRLRNLVQTISNLSGESFSATAELGKNQDVFPSEIGKILIDKLTFGAEGYHACISLIDKYKEQDLQNLLNAIRVGVKQRNIDTVTDSTQQLCEVFDNLWKDADKIATTSNRISYAIPFTLATLGSLASQEIGGLAGLLSGLAIKYLDRKISQRATEKLAQLRSNDSVISIYEFKKKYNINAKGLG